VVKEICDPTLHFIDGLSPQQIADEHAEFGVEYKVDSVKKIIAMFKATLRVARDRRRGRGCGWRQWEIDRIKEFIKDNPNCFLDELHTYVLVPTAPGESIHPPSASRQAAIFQEGHLPY
jgi:hypothetical protein